MLRSPGMRNAIVFGLVCDQAACFERKLHQLNDEYDGECDMSSANFPDREFDEKPRAGGCAEAPHRRRGKSGYSLLILK